MPISLAHRGASPEAVPLAERGVASRGCGSQLPSREARNPPARHYDLCREELRCTRCGGNAADGSAEPGAENRHGGAPKGARLSVVSAFTRVLRAMRDAGRFANARTRYVTARPTGCRCTRAPVGAPPTPRRWVQVSRPGRVSAAGTMRAV